MCGIAGLLNRDRDSLVDRATVRRMCRTIVHRGPDDEGIYVQGWVGLGMRRLSIIDLAGGRQPIHNEDSSIWIVFNGEIYNFPELRRHLEERGHRFYTNTDTEAIVHLYEDFGPECVQRLRGMFAFAIFDEPHQRLLLARDRLGIKPLHYACAPDRLIFGSEIKAILAAAPELAEINPQALLDYFYFGYIPEPATAFKRIQKLPPGHVALWTNSQISVRQYWDLPAYGASEPASEEECLQELETRLAEAVRMRLISDVPLGALLSGGVDSSLVVALMARASNAPVKTFSVGFSKRDFNEAQHARRVAQCFGTEHHELHVEPAIAQTIDDLTRALEEPFGDSSMIPTFYISRLAREHVTVALSGDGGDELFAGYDRYAIGLRRRALDPVPEWARRWYREHLHPLIPRSARGRAYAYNMALPWQERYLDSISFLPGFERQTTLLSDEFRASIDPGHDPLETFRACLDGAPAKDPLSQLLYLDTKTYLPGDILTKVDRMSMATSLEARVPLLDHLFVEYATSLPARWKLCGLQQKYILKKLAVRVGVPPEVVYRPKQGF
ncbi:MAG TPA: asparagine synthase (glutamine-hydrolyzing), partial [Terriglobia bacterium]|nr:asparagine synthase (glutamine-hydrolyzing) [Terriglobia bacterium]